MLGVKDKKRYVHIFYPGFFFKHNHTPSRKKRVTGVQAVTASKVPKYQV